MKDLQKVKDGATVKPTVVDLNFNRPKKKVIRYG